MPVSTFACPPSIVTKINGQKIPTCFPQPVENIRTVSCSGESLGMFYKRPVTPTCLHPGEVGTFSLLVRGNKNTIKLSLAKRNLPLFKSLHFNNLWG